MYHAVIWINMRAERIINLAVAYYVFVWATFESHWLMHHFTRIQKEVWCGKMRLYIVQFYVHWRAVLLWVDNAHQKLDADLNSSADNVSKIHDETKVHIALFLQIHDETKVHIALFLQIAY